MLRHEWNTGEEFCFEAGGKLDSITLVYHTSEREYRPGDRVVWICHALTGNSDAEDWWPQIVGPDKMVDTQKDFVVCVNMLCSSYGSSGPASINPSTGKPYLLDFPSTTVRDIVSADILVRKHLGIESIDILIGPSIGGYQAIEWVVREPDVIKKAIFIATFCRVTPFITALNETQRMALRADSSFLEAASLEGGKAGLACARTVALVSYRTEEGYNITQAEKDDDTLFADRAASYQRYQGKKLVDRFDAYSYWYLSNALDSVNVGRGRGGVAKALSLIKAKCVMIGIDSDVLFPPRELRTMVSQIPNCSYHEIHSVFGHDGFLIENDQLSKILEEYL